MELDGKYLLKLKADRLLAPYLKEAGLNPKAENYGGWESDGELGEGLDGHSLGHYLSALSMIYASTGRQILQTEHGGMKEVMADLYAITEDQKYLDLSDRFTHKVIGNPLADRKDELEELHANTQIPKIIGAARNYEVSGDEEMRELSTFFRETVVNERTYANGGNSDHEHFGPKGGIISEE